MTKTLTDLMQSGYNAFTNNDYSQTISHCEAVLSIAPDKAEAHHLMSHAYKVLGNHHLSEALLYRAIALDSANPQYHYNAAVNASEQGHQNRAMLHYAQALRVSPDMHDALWNYGECLRLDEHFDLALACFERLVSLGQTHYRGLWHRMAVCCASLGHYDRADDMFLRAIAEGETLSRWEYALFLLSLEKFKAGFAYYNDRFLCDGRNSVFCHDFPYPLWDGTFTKGSMILIHGEQGLGDELMFASLFHELLNDAAANDARVIIGCKPPVARLFSESFANVDIRAHKVGEHAADVSDLPITAQLPMGHLPSIYRHTEQDFISHQGAYFKANAERIAYYATQIVKLGRERIDGQRRFRVGLMWGSNPAAVSAKFTRWSSQRSIHIGLFEPFAELIGDVEFVSLQNAERGAEAALAPKLNIVDFSLDQADFYDTAALISNLDLVISVDTSVSHLAGGMAVETWVPLMSRPDWRHGKTRQRSLWYSNTHYFRQTMPNDWRKVLDEMQQALRERVSQWKQSQPHKP